MEDLSSKTIGFLGCGKISSAVCRGYARATAPHRPQRILVSKRSVDKSAALKSEFNDLVEVYDSNDNIVEEADIIFIGLLTNVAKEVLPTLTFSGSKIVISMMAAVNYEELLTLTGLSKEQVVKTVPLPSAANRQGPILSFPSNEQAERILKVVGTPIPCPDELRMKTMISLTGHISSFFELMRANQDWMTSEGVDESTARKFISSFYSSMAMGADSSNDSFEELAHEAATPGGINEQSINFLRSTEHYNLQKTSMTAIHDRLLGKATKK